MKTLIKKITVAIAIVRYNEGVGFFGRFGAIDTVNGIDSKSLDYAYNKITR